MKEDIFSEVKAALVRCADAQERSTARWHAVDPEVPVCPKGHSLEHLSALVLLQHYYNFRLWHVEDTARRRDVPDSVIAECKRTVDRLNQKRNDAMEEVDRCLYEVITPCLSETALFHQNTETLGMAIDRLSILALKVYHMEEQTGRTDAHSKHVRVCSDRLQILRRQRQDLGAAVLELVDEYAIGRKRPVRYAQFKMYNDPDLNPELYGGEKWAFGHDG